MNIKSLIFPLTLMIFSYLCLGQLQGQDSITVEKIWGSYEYSAKRIPGFNFMKDGVHYSRLENNNIISYDLTTGKASETILQGSELAKNTNFNGELEGYHFNNDESKIIIESESERIYRHSSKAYYYLFDRKSKIITPINDGKKIMYASLSPDGGKVGYVMDNNLYYLNLSDNKITQITTDGEKNMIINGSADWVYEEEFSFAQAFEWSPDGQRIAFMRFDESAVPEFTMTKFNNDLYPEYVTFKYPKVGEKNATVTVHLYNLENKKTITVDLQGEEEMYIPRIKWTNDPNKVVIYKMNRHQNHLQLLLTDASNGNSKILLDEKNKYYIEITDDITFLENNKSFIWSSEKSGYNHLYVYDMEGKEKAKLTSGNYDVTNFYGIDEENQRAFYRAAEKSALEKQVYSVDLDGKKKEIVTPFQGTNSAQFSSTFDYYVNTNSTINSAPTYDVYNRQGKSVRAIEKNLASLESQKSYETQDVEFFDFKTTEGVSLNGWMIKPPNFDATKKHPVFMYLYGGPGSQQVTDGWKGQNYWWFQMLAQKGYIVACVDNRGTGARGEEFRKQTYMKLGELETIDQIEAAKFLGGLPYTDASRIGIFGWSYGGYMSSLCLFKGADVFKAAIAVAPVTNWRWYDSIYTERYMRTGAENPEGYAQNSPVNFADQLKGNYLLVHGMGDDNVHWQNSVEMANALIKANKQFDTYYYPNRNHGIYGGNTRLHLYNKMTNFILEKL